MGLLTTLLNSAFTPSHEVIKFMIKNITRIALSMLVLSALSARAHAEENFTLVSSSDAKITTKAEIFKFLAGMNRLELSSIFPKEKYPVLSGKTLSCMNAGGMDRQESALLSSGYHIIEISNFRIGQKTIEVKKLRVGDTVGPQTFKLPVMEFDLLYGDGEKTEPVSTATKICNIEN